MFAITNHQTYRNGLDTGGHSDKKMENSGQKNLNSVTIQFGSDVKLSPKEQIKEQTGIDLDTEEYVCISTSGDENVCPMCAQFEGKFFHKDDAPKLPLCPSCACAYLHYDKQDLPPDAVISNKEDFILPAKCTSLFYKHQQDIPNEADAEKVIRICEKDLKKLPELMTPYLSAGFPAPTELFCRDLLPELYIQRGEWKKAEKAIKKCIEAKAYFPDDGSTELSYLESYQKVATETLSYISQNPGCLQRNIYKAMGYEGEEKEQLKYFLRNSSLIEKVKYNKTNQLFCKTNESADNAGTNNTGK